MNVQSGFSKFSDAELVAMYAESCAQRDNRSKDARYHDTFKYYDKLATNQRKELVARGIVPQDEAMSENHPMRDLFDETYFRHRWKRYGR